MANQEKTNREEDGKQEKLPQEGYGQKPVSKREMEREAENYMAVKKVIAFFYPLLLDFAEYKCRDYGLNEDPKILLDNLIFQKRVCGDYDRLKSAIDELRNSIAHSIDSEVRNKACGQGRQYESLDSWVFGIDKKGGQL